MITNIHEGEYETEGNVRWELFDKELEVMIDNDTDIEYAEKCAEALNSLSEDTVKAICEAAKRYCLHFKDICGDEWDEWNEMSFKITKNTPAEQLKSEIYPTVLIVDKPEDERIGFHIECNCSWEPEHGLEITILDGKLVYLGAFESRRAWSRFDPEEEWNFVNGVK